MAGQELPGTHHYSTGTVPSRDTLSRFDKQSARSREFPAPGALFASVYVKG
ncbi:hypothetical protein BACCAP_03492 [Pseudoflavonifractor capillosus ATCC 29799]|uniref:Uncharacterized protein n=1 Tax=Pseudoflavonifractor capillosus ATCC 29799 TaxID=411467 RepID=A6NZ41_9FIRM|nr:hypothetical protein BACCAP_03492 [Pseudoflavonifractor capillosus ATCC 29799]